MIAYYTALHYIVIFSLLTMSAIVHSNEGLQKRYKQGFSFSFITLAIVTFLHTFSMYLEQLGPKYRVHNIILHIIYLSLTPLIPVLIGNTLIKVNYRKTVLFCLITNFIFQCMSAFNGYIFYIDKNNVYYRGKYFVVFFFFCTTAALVLINSVYKLNLIYHSKSNYILVLIFLSLFTGNFIQLFVRDLETIWIACASSLTMLYMYYNQLISQIDSLSSLFNRQCYENNIDDLKENTIILFFDMNKFKKVNDTYGHLFGDYCITEIGNIIKNNYGKYGRCYRIGGDEFCVLLYNKINDIESLNNNFKNTIIEKQKTEPRLPNVSIGYAFFNPYSKKSVQESIEEADLMMYAEKHKKK